MFEQVVIMEREISFSSLLGIEGLIMMPWSYKQLLIVRKQIMYDNLRWGIHPLQFQQIAGHHTLHSTRTQLVPKVAANQEFSLGIKKVKRTKLLHFFTLLCHPRTN